MTGTTFPMKCSTEEINQAKMSSKKQKGGSSSFLLQRPLRSYKDFLVHLENTWDSSFCFDNLPSPHEDDSNVEEDDNDGILAILLSKTEKLCIQTPWVCSHHQTVWEICQFQTHGFQDLWTLETTRGTSMYWPRFGFFLGALQTFGGLLEGRAWKSMVCVSTVPGKD